MENKNPRQKIYLGNSIYACGHRVFKSVFVGGRDGRTQTILLSWSDKHCKVCGRFLSKKESKFCAACRPNEHRKKVKECGINYYNNPEYREEQKLRCRVRTNAERYEVGQIV